jgi:hypothetical protein
VLPDFQDLLLSAHDGLVICDRTHMDLLAVKHWGKAHGRLKTNSLSHFSPAAAASAPSVDRHQIFHRMGMRLLRIVQVVEHAHSPQA